MDKEEKMVNCSKCGELKSPNRIIKNRKICKDCVNLKSKERKIINMQNIDLESIIEQNLIETSVSSQISMQSLKSVFQNLIETYNEGLGLSDIRNLMFLITFIRFLFLLTN